MSAEFSCKLCQSPVKQSIKKAGSITHALLEHFSTEHNIKICDTKVVDNLLVMHNLPTTSGKRIMSLSQGFIPKGKENVTPIKPRLPLQEVRTNRDNIVSTPSKRESLPSSDLRPNQVQDNLDKMDNSLLLKPKEWVNLGNEKQFEISSSSICIISSVASAEQLSSSLIEEHEQNNDSNNVSRRPKDISTSSHNNSTDTDSSWLSDKNYEAINMRRLMTAAGKGRYICPKEKCSFKCESKVLMNIHIRKRHQDIYGLPVKKQQMMIFLEKVSVSSYFDDSNSEEKNRKEHEAREIENIDVDQENLDIVEEDFHKNLVVLKHIDDKDIPKITNIIKSLKRKYQTESLEKGEDKETVKLAKRRKLDYQDNVFKTIFKTENIPGIKNGKNENQPKQNDIEREKTVEKMRFLQSGKSNGTYVQCSLKGCGKWRYLEGCEDPSQIPDTWECSMNPSLLSNSCEKGASEEFVEDNEEFVDTLYAPGSMVWAKMKGYPWWPAMVDFCPDTDEYYWLDSWNQDESRNHPEADSKPTWYHVVFFDVPQVKRAWIKVEEIEKLDSITHPPRSSTVIKTALKVKWKKILTMAIECFNLEREKRLEQFSFAALYDGKWGYYDENTKVVKGKSKLTLINKDETEKTRDEQNQPKLVWKPSDLIPLWNNKCSHKINTEEWVCDICRKYFPYVENVVVNHLKFHHMDVQEYLYKFSINRSNNLGIIKWGLKKSIQDLFYSETVKLDDEKGPTQMKIAIKPPLEPGVLLSILFKIFGEVKVSDEDLNDLLTVLFPYFNQDKDICLDIITKAKHVDDERIHSTLSESEQKLEESLAFPGLLKRLNFERYNGTKKWEKPNCSEFLLCVLALQIIKQPATANQISILLSIIFPALLQNLKELKISIDEVLSEEKEFVRSPKMGIFYYNINLIELRNTKKMLKEFVQNIHNQEKFYESYFDSSVLNCFFKSIDIHV